MFPFLFTTHNSIIDVGKGSLCVLGIGTGKKHHVFVKVKVVKIFCNVVKGQYFVMW